MKIVKTNVHTHKSIVLREKVPESIADALKKDYIRILYRTGEHEDYVISVEK